MWQFTATLSRREICRVLYGRGSLIFRTMEHFEFGACWVLIHLERGAQALQTRKDPWRLLWDGRNVRTTRCRSPPRGIERGARTSDGER
jgi:hypothetical protein